ncbi:DUF5405 family protein [Acerihabitans sp. TG2]|uniref:DUF5405 family protein n=1 Tax=Acerihabitans sp. TG2 TaxID=3096008 RepID=UPI002B2262B4|nr:DUF5405 family protein [Acerihabitans sp. TG2]MEA9389541.1 DUF5405 family protein [Acerihabitans sp. TG2]
MRLEIDGRYAITRFKDDYVLHHITLGLAGEPRLTVLALYQTPVELISDLVNHATRRAGLADIPALIAEMQRLAELCQRAFNLPTL